GWTRRGHGHVALWAISIGVRSVHRLAAGARAAEHPEPFAARGGGGYFREGGLYARARNRRSDPRNPDASARDRGARRPRPAEPSSVLRARLPPPAGLPRPPRQSGLGRTDALG